MPQSRPGPSEKKTRKPDRFVNPRPAFEGIASEHHSGQYSDRRKCQDGDYGIIEEHQASESLAVQSLESCGTRSVVHGLAKETEESLAMSVANDRSWAISERAATSQDPPDQVGILAHPEGLVESSGLEEGLAAKGRVGGRKVRGEIVGSRKEPFLIEDAECLGEQGRSGVDSPRPDAATRDKHLGVFEGFQKVPKPLAMHDTIAVGDGDNRSTSRLDSGVARRSRSTRRTIDNSNRVLLEFFTRPIRRSIVDRDDFTGQFRREVLIQHGLQTRLDVAAAIVEGNHDRDIGRAGHVRPFPRS